ncbi:MAG: PDZ domain-containing protein, partial [Candidatus Entotheonellia bacterium]
VLGRLREKGRVTRGWLGVQVQRVTPELAKSFGLARDRGALVTNVMPDGPAERGGLQQGDVIVEYNVHSIEAMSDLPHLVAMTPPGTEATFKVVRKGAEQTLHVTVGELKEERTAAGGEGGLEGHLGLTVQDLTPEIARSLGLSDSEGVVVSKVEPNSPADNAGIQRGDVIEEVNRQRIANLQDYRTTLGQVQGDASVLLLVRRGQSALYAVLKPGE